ncbi:hypothetical protein C8J56DRAFT_770287 [Mycena floridula]|nr:hypothetical protein C8J56DRAFT_770287 [Mycena floridula]
MFSMLKLVVASVALAFAVAGHDHRGLESHHHPDLDPKCPDGSHTGFVVNSFQYDIPIDGFIDATGSFFNITWYAGTVVNATTGNDNVVGATRSGPFLDGKFAEQLVAYDASSTSLTMKYVSLVDLVVTGAIPENPHQKLAFDSYTEEFRALGICGHEATYIEFATTFCSNKPDVVYDLFDQLHTSSVGELNKKLGGRVFRGTCPGTSH